MLDILTYTPYYELIKLLPSCISLLYINHHRHIDIILNLLIPYFLTFISKHNMLVKMLEPENFNEILRPRAVVECPGFSGFISPPIRFILLIAFARIKDFYISFFINTMLSVCTVFGNISTAHAFSTRYPASCSTSKSLTRLVGLQLI